jgi:probable HAF family extracellular repeat protein
MKHPIRILFITAAIVFRLATASGQTWDLAGNFSETNNPNGAWSYGQIGFTVLPALWNDAGQGFVFWCPLDTQTPVVGINQNAITQAGIPPGTATLECDFASPDARWTAPSPGSYNIQIHIGGTTSRDSLGIGNANVTNAGVAINGIAQSPNNFVNNIKTWTFSNLPLNAGDTVDAFVTKQYGSGNTATIFTVAAVAGTPPPSTNYYVDWLKVAGGGGTSTGGVYTATVTFGQADAGGSISGGGYTATFGFWSLLGQGAPALIPTVPIITSQPQSLFVNNGSPAAFNVSVSGTPPFYYQWQKNGVNLNDGGNISGSAIASLALSTTSTNDAGSYSVIIWNNYGNVTNSSVAKLTLILPTSLILPTYSVTDLGSLGGSSSYAYGINDSGQVVGYSLTAGNALDHAFLYSGGTMNDLGTLGGNFSYAYGINNSGQVVGVAATAGNAAYHAFLYSGGTMNDLGTLGGGASYAYGINNGGKVVGYSLTLSNFYHAFLYGGGTMNDLGTLGGGDSYAYGINDSGQVVGDSLTAGNALDHAFFYSGGTMNDLGTFGGNSSYAYGINNSGQVVGYADTAGDAADHAFLYSGGPLVDSGTLGGSDSDAYGINDSGQVVGYAATAGNVNHAFLYSGGVMNDLNNLINTNTLGAYLYEALGINDSGQIIANGNNNNNYHAYLLTPNETNVHPRVQAAKASGGNFQFSWNTVNTYPAVGYQVQYTTNLVSPNWLNLGGILTAAPLSATDTISTNAQRFYRVLLVQ